MMKNWFESESVYRDFQAVVNTYEINEGWLDAVEENINFHKDMARLRRDEEYEDVYFKVR